MLYLTQHFRDMWAARGAGPVPCVDDVQQWIAGAVRLQCYREAFTARGRRLKFLALYWVPHLDVILKVDESSSESRVVTVLTPSTKDEPPYLRNGADRGLE